MVVVWYGREEAGGWLAEVELDEMMLECPGDRLVLLKLS
jgi:hypothetical protein